MPYAILSGVRNRIGSPCRGSSGLGAHANIPDQGGLSPCHPVSSGLLGETQHTCSPQIGNPQQTEVRIPPESTLVNQCILLRLFTGAETTQRPQHYQSHVGMVTAHKAGDLQAAHEVGECSIQVPQLV